MNYFELYQLPVSFHPNRAEVKSRFYELSKKYHPDFYINQPKDKQNQALELATLNNKAYQVLTNPHQLLPYVLTLKGILVEGESYILPQNFLIEMMNTNEAITTLQPEADKTKLNAVKQDILKMEKSLTEQIEQYAKQFDVQPKNIDLLAKIKDLYYRKKYLTRLQENLSKLSQ